MSNIKLFFTILNFVHVKLIPFYAHGFVVSVAFLQSHCLADQTQKNIILPFKTFSTTVLQTLAYLPIRASHGEINIKINKKYFCNQWQAINLFYTNCKKVTMNVTFIV